MECIKKMKFEKLSHIPGGEHDWYFQIGNTDGRKAPFCVRLNYSSGYGFALTIHLNTEKLMKLFGFNQKIIGT